MNVMAEEQDPYRLLEEALVGLQTTLRTNGLQQLASLTPVVVGDEADLRRLHRRLITLMHLVALNTPRPTVLHKVTASFERVVKFVVVVEEWIKTNH